MKHIHITSLRTRLMVLVFLALVPSIGLMVFNSVERRKEAANQVNKDAERLIERTSGECQRLLDGSRDTLLVMAQTPDVNAMKCPACAALFRRILPKNPQYTNLGLADVHGALRCSALPARTGINIGDRGYFRRVIASKGFAVGEYQVGRINGRPAVNVAYPVMNAAGKIQGVLFASLDLGFLNQMASNLNLPRGATFTVADRNGTIIVHYPEAGQWIGRPFRDLPEGRTALERDNGVVQLRDAGGELRQYVFAALTEARAGIEAHVSVGIPHSVAFAEVNRARLRNGIILAIVVVLTLFAAYFSADALVLRRIHGLIRATQLVGAGDLGARTGIASPHDEIGRLALSFDNMTQFLQDARKRLLDAERDRLRVYTEVIRAVTQDKFYLVEPGTIPDAGEPVFSILLENPADFRTLRHSIRRIGEDVGMAPENIGALIQATGEAATNTQKHAQNGRCAVYTSPSRLIARISDSGQGIKAEDLAATILRPGFSTKVSLGMGYTLMLELADRVWLATGPEGTTVQLEKSLALRSAIEPALADAMERF